MVMLSIAFAHGPWSEVDSIDGRTFPRYQCATPKESWQETCAQRSRIVPGTRMCGVFLTA